MTATEFNRLKDMVTAAWGNTSKWQNTSQAFDAFATIRRADFHLCVQVVNDLVSQGLPHAPSIGQVTGAAQRLTGDTFDKTRCAHTNWAIVEETDGVRLGVCAGCQIEREFPADELTTAGEREDAEKARTR